MRGLSTRGRVHECNFSGMLRLAREHGTPQTARADKPPVAPGFAVNRAGFLIADAAVALRVELIEVDLSAAGDRRIEGLQRHRDQAQLQVALPARPHCHRSSRGVAQRSGPSMPRARSCFRIKPSACWHCKQSIAGRSFGSVRFENADSDGRALKPNHAGAKSSTTTPSGALPEGTGSISRTGGPAR